MTHENWDQHYSGEHHGHQQDQPGSAELAGFIAGLAEIPRRALDLGCGTGADAVFLAEQGIATTGIDLSATALEHARQRAERHDVSVEWMQGDALHLPLEDGCMDLVLDRGCLHHIASGEHGRYAAEVARVLRPGGTLLVREMNVVGHHEHAVSEASLRAMIEGVSLQMRSIVTHGGTGGRRTMLAVIDRG
jgi:ubiquinone/menaquinone biosynthesis C-methylase UbiE